MRRSVAILLAASGCVLAGCAPSPAQSLRASAVSAISSASAGPPSTVKAVTYHGVTLTVPTSWPVVDGAHAAPCANPFQSKPTVFVGGLIFAPSCPAFRPDHNVPKADGVWLTKQEFPDAASSRVVTADGVTLLTQQSGADATSDYFWVDGVSVQLGRGSDPAVAQAIRDSIRLTPASADSPVQGYCPRDGSAPMPTPERLTETMVLESGDVTLRPPRPADVTQIGAFQAWSSTGTPQPGTTYRLLLARYSSRFPARLNADGSTAPLNVDKLAWVVLAQPLQTPLGACGLYGINAYNARSGDALGGIGYSSGP